MNKKYNKINSSKITNKVRLNKIYIYFLYFFLFSFIGWLLETFYAICTLGYFTKRGFLYGPLCPIYGFGALILIIFLEKYKKNNIKLFFYASVIFSIFEYIVSYILDALFSMHWWDYTYDFMNLNGRISIFYSFAWGFIAIIFLNHIFPFFRKKINIILSKISYKIQITIIWILNLLISFDFIISSVRYLI